MLKKALVVLITAGVLSAAVDWSSFLKQVSNAQGSESNVTCLLSNCLQEIKTCFTSIECIRATLCVVPCGSDMNCTMNCMINYGNNKLTDFLTCASGEHNCIKLAPQVPPYHCNVPRKGDSSFNYKILPGSWYVLKGGNPVYDCFPCQITTFGSVQADGSIDAVMNYQALKENGEVRKMEQKSHIIPDQNKSEVLHLSSNDYGSTLEDDWLIIDHEPEKYVLVYYCGKIPTGGGDYWFYEGGVLYSKTASFEELDFKKINNSAFEAGINLEKWCNPNQKNCI